MEHLKLKTKMDGFKSRLDLAEGRINEMEERSEEIFQNSYGETKQKKENYES